MLSGAGFTVDIFEQAEILTEVGAGLQLSANAMQVLDKMGLAAKIAALAFEPENAVTRDYKTGQAQLTMPLKGAHKTRYHQPYYHIHRADLHDVLRQAALDQGANIHLGHAVQSLSQTDKKVSIQCRDKTYSGDIVIGADGIHSAVREALFGAQAPRFTGQTAWRGLVKASDIHSGTIPPDANAWLGPRRHFVSYYVRGGELINFVAVEERDNWTDEGWNHTGSIDDVKRAFSGWDPRIKTLLGACETCHLWGLFDRAPLLNWTKGHAALLGDACHPMLPFMAQGAAMALEDASVLAQTLTANPNNIETALQRYEALRKPRASKVQAISRSNAKLFHLSGAARAVRTAKFKAASLLPALAHARFDPIYGVDVTQMKV